MATVMAIQPLAPRPSPHAVAAWSPPTRFVDDKENRSQWKKQAQQPIQAARVRADRPCDGCRRRKSNCVLQTAHRCMLCETHSEDCTFQEEPQPRKRKPKEELRPAPASKRTPVTSRSSTTVSSPGQERIAAAASGTAQAATKEPGPFAVDATLSLQRHRHCKYHGQTTALDSTLLTMGSFNSKNETESAAGTLRQVTADEFFSIHADADVPIPADEARALAELETIVGRHGSALIDTYFRNVHPSYSIIQKEAFLDRQRHGDRQFNPPLLAAMYLLALQWWDGDPDLAQHAKPDAARIEYIAFTSLTVALQRPKISAVQAGLLLLQRAKYSTWTLTVQLVAVGQDIGLHLDCSDWSIPLWERRLRKRLAWALYMQDKWSALMHGRPSHINAVDWAVPSLTQDDFNDSILPDVVEHTVDAETRKGRTLFTQMISLTNILAEVCGTFYSQTAKTEIARAGQYATQLILSRAKAVQIKLKDWFTKLPPECKMDAYTTGQLSSTGYLHLGYFAAEISIHRRIVQSLDPHTADPYMLYICRSAAKTRLISAMDFVNRLRPEHLDAFWYFPSSFNFSLIGTFGALLMATSPAREEAEFYACRLREFKWTLDVSTKKAAWMGSAVQMLESNIRMLERLPEKEVAVPRQHQARRVHQEGYEDQTDMRDRYDSGSDDGMDVDDDDNED